MRWKMQLGEAELADHAKHSTAKREVTKLPIARQMGKWHTLVCEVKRVRSSKGGAHFVMTRRTFAGRERDVPKCVFVKANSRP